MSIFFKNGTRKTASYEWRQWITLQLEFKFEMIYLFLQLLTLLQMSLIPLPTFAPSILPQPFSSYGPNHIVVCVKIIYLLLDFRKLKLTNQKSMLFLKKRRHPASTCPSTSITGCGYSLNSKSCLKNRIQ